jgi:hypothetical protein
MPSINCKLPVLHAQAGFHVYQSYLVALLHPKFREQQTCHCWRGGSSVLHKVGFLPSLCPHPHPHSCHHHHHQRGLLRLLRDKHEVSLMKICF